MKIAIVGGGAAGLMAAIAAKSEAPDHEVFLLEKNAYLGAKVLISGGGRCNVTTGITDLKKVLEHYPRGAKFLKTAMYGFSPKKVMEWFESHGVRLKIEEDLRVFPCSDNGQDVVGALVNELKKLGVHIILNDQVIAVKKISSVSEKFHFEIFYKSGRTLDVEKVILTTGGNAYRHTGSTGDGYAFAKALGHSITPLAPSLNSFIVAENWVKSLAGVSFEKAKLTLQKSARVVLLANLKEQNDSMHQHHSADKNSFLHESSSRSNSLSHQHDNVFIRTGPFLFTHYGVTGPAVFALSSMAAYEYYDRQQPFTLSINFFPDMNSQQLKTFWHELAQKHGKKTLVNFLDMLLPKSLCPVVIDLSGLDPLLQVARLDRDQVGEILHLLQDFRLQVIGRGVGDEFVTAGGVALEEVNPNTMESKLCPGLFFAGEILDVDGFTGGFNLQASWATGFLAGHSLMKK